MSNEMLQVSVDINESAIADFVNKRVREEVTQEIEFSVEDMTRKVLTRHVRKTLKAIVEKEGFLAQFEGCVDDVVEGFVGDAALRELVVSKAFATVLRTEAARLSNPKNRKVQHEQP